MGGRPGIGDRMAMARLGCVPGVEAFSCRLDKAAPACSAGSWRVTTAARAWLTPAIRGAEWERRHGEGWLSTVLMRVGEGVVARVRVQRADACSDLESAPGVAKKKKRKEKGLQVVNFRVQRLHSALCCSLLTAAPVQVLGWLEARAPIAFAIRAHGWMEALTSLRDAGSTGVRLGESLE